MEMKKSEREIPRDPHRMPHTIYIISLPLPRFTTDFCLTGKLMRKKSLLIFIITFCTLIIVPTSCSSKYYTNHQGKVTKGYNKPPKKLKKPGSRYLEQARRQG